MEDGSIDRTEFAADYRRVLFLKLVLLVVCIGGIVLFIGLFSLATYDGVSLRQTYEIIWNHLVGNQYEPRSLCWWADRYIWNTAMPHVVAAILAGSGLAACGVLMQALMVNPLADPYSTGISSGACFGAVSAIVTGISFSSVAGEAGIVVNAFIGALVPAIAIIVLSERIRMPPATLILLGTAISYFFNSMVTYMMVSTDADTLKSAYMWQIGSLDGIGWSSLYIMAAVTVVGSVIIMILSRKLNVMSLGESSAISLGLDVRRFRTVCLVLMSVMTAAIVAFTGILGFVGLVAPHLVRLVAGSDNRFVVPISMTVGSFLLLASDYVCSILSDIPVGVVLSIIGSPVFFILIVFQAKRSGAVYRWVPARPNILQPTAARAFSYSPSSRWRRHRSSSLWDSERSTSLSPMPLGPSSTV